MNSYREILSNYHSNNQYLLLDGFNQLRKDMGFTQIRFYCFKKKRGRVFHIMTNEGAHVIRFFTISNPMLKACVTFTRPADDNSTLATNCDKWGFPDYNQWESKNVLSNDRLFSKPSTWRNNRFYRFIHDTPYQCDDET